MEFNKKMAKHAAFDIGDQWVGVAISDSLGMFARPYTSIRREELDAFLEKFIIDEQLASIVIGLPKTMKGSESSQTTSTRELCARLQEKFVAMKFVLWDERLTSQWAGQLSKNKKYNQHSMKSAREDKIKEHARAAAYILDSYLPSQQ